MNKVEISANKSIETHYFVLKRNKQYFDFIETYKNNFDSVDLDKFVKILEVSTLANIIYLDLSVIGKHLYNAQSDWEKIYFIKNAYLTTYESLKTLNSKYLQFIKNNMETCSENSKELFMKLNEVRSNFKKYRDIEKIRNNVSGHILDKYDFSQFYDEIMKFDADKTALMIIDVMKIFEILLLLCNSIMEDFRLNEKI